MRHSNFIGATIAGAVARELWLDGELVSPCCVVYFSGSDGNGWKLSFNDDPLEWELSNSTDFLEAGTVEGFDGFHYPAVDLASAYALTSLKVTDFSETNEETYAQALIQFSCGKAIAFRHWYESDKETIVEYETFPKDSVN